MSMCSTYPLYFKEHHLHLIHWLVPKQTVCYKCTTWNVIWEKRSIHINLFYFTFTYRFLRLITQPGTEPMTSPVAKMSWSIENTDTSPTSEDVQLKRFILMLSLHVPPCFSPKVKKDSQSCDTITVM